MKLIQLAHQSPQQMMGYIIVAPDGGVSVIDGGNTSEGAYLLELLKRYAGKKPHIRYWFLTHAHNDHVNAFLALLPQRDYAFTLDSLVYAFPASDELLRLEPSETDPILYMERLNLEHVEPKTGDVFDLGGADMTVLQTYATDGTDRSINDTTTVLQLDGEGVRTIFLGDLGPTAGDRLLKTYGDRLKCDVAQMAHHGQNGVTREVYDAMKPDVCLWNAPTWLWENTIDPLRPGHGPWTTLVTREWMRLLGDHQRHVVAKDGTWEIDMTGGKCEFSLIDRRTGEVRS